MRDKQLLHFIIDGDELLKSMAWIPEWHIFHIAQASYQKISINNAISQATISGKEGWIPEVLQPLIKLFFTTI